MATNTLPQWFQTPLGQYLLEKERSYLDDVTPDIFGFHALQLGLPEVDLLRESRIAHRMCSAGTGEPDIYARCHELPFATQSIDLVVLPHVLEFAEEPHAILREVDRVMMPEGRIVILGFNPWSLWGMRSALGFSREQVPWNGRFLSLLRVKDWLALLGFEIVGGEMACYALPSRQQKWLDRTRFMEAAGDRWWPIGGGVYFLQAVKRVRGVRLIMPKWSDRLAPAKRLAASPQKVEKDETVAVRSYEQQTSE